MKKTAIVLLAIIFASLSIISCQRAKEPEGEKEVQTQKQEVQVQREEVKQQPSETKIESKMPQQLEAKPEAGEPQLIWQKDFGAKIRWFELHKEVGVMDFPVMSVETEDALIIFDKKGNETIRRQIPKYELEQKGKKETYRGYVVISANGKYVLEGRGIPDFSSYDLKYTTVDGKMLWEKKDFVGKPVVSPDGSVVVLLNLKGGKYKYLYDSSGKLAGMIPPKRGNVEFYNSSGRLLKHHSMDLSGIDSFAYGLAFSEDGNYFILELQQWIEDKAGRRAIYPIILFNKKGNLLWQKNIEVTPGRTSHFVLLISPSGNRIAYSSDKYIHVVDKKGNLLWRAGFHNLFSFSTNEDILLMSDNEGFLIVDAQSGKKIWSKVQGYPKLSPDKTLLAVIGSIREFNEEKLVLEIVNMTDKKEKLIMKRKAVHLMKRRFLFSSDSKSLFYIEEESETKISVYKLAISTIED